ncbi:transcription factor MYB3R-1 isoform X2 [Amborella trichopoda]|uniref:transcription factor MYB3R-1 isoform X2 n=1 Tax=Amborella trichopoda TaxID=13333 RepID=UPI0009C14388|nr:transcription factor MYB3R-1 isoform X2 [Amborella trichopoda]|eukprot:XP_020523604.1 transcription factor MYB3R-1 isoform X2 [Amborella trichopoda]
MSGPAKCSTYGGWMPKENEILRKAVHCYNGRQWKEIGCCLHLTWMAIITRQLLSIPLYAAMQHDTFFTYRTEVQCYHRWHKVLNPDLVKGQWSKEGDDMIIELVLQHGAKNWSTIAQALLGWNGKQCRERYSMESLYH